MTMINLEIMQSPINWFKVPLMAATGMIGVLMIVDLISRKDTVKNA